ncbi:MAG: AraC family transcriptional regulator [Myxococcales bacterium]|nr:AraC family transcriptional regulator [Myxococcales bacterium]
MDSATAALTVDLRAIVAGASALGLDAATLHRVARGQPDLHQGLGAVWRSILAERPGWDTPFWIGASVPFGHYDVVDYLAGSSRTLRDGLQRLQRYFRLVSTKVEVSLAHATLTIRPGVGPALQRAVMGMYTSGTVLGRFHRAAGGTLALAEVCVGAPAPDTDQLEDWLRAPCTFEHDHFAFRFQPGGLDQPLRDADPQLLRVLTRYADELLSRRDDETDPVGPIRRAIREELPGREPTLAATARRLGVSERSLQRRLADASTNFRDLLGEERMAWAQSLLRRPLPVQEVAHLLGYSEQSAFARAFRRWTGRTPRDYQRAT